MKKTCTLLFAFLVSLWVHAQVKTTVAFLPLSYEEGVFSAIDVKMVQETVTNAFVESKKFIIVDREKLEELDKEKNLQRSEAFMDSQNSFTDGLSKGANYIVDGRLLDINYDNKSGYTADIQVQLRLLNVSTGEIMATGVVNSAFPKESAAVKKAMKNIYTKDELKQIEAQNYKLVSRKETQREAFNAALSILSNNVNKYTATLFPMHVDIIKWDTKKNEILLGAGHAIGVQVGQMVEVVKFSEVIRGEETLTRNEMIGTAYIVKVDDQNFSVATIVDKEKEITKALKANVQLGMIIR